MDIPGEIVNLILNFKGVDRGEELREISTKNTEDSKEDSKEDSEAKITLSRPKIFTVRMKKFILRVKNKCIENAKRGEYCGEFKRLGYEFHPEFIALSTIRGAREVIKHFKKNGFKDVKLPKNENHEVIAIQLWW